MARFQQEMCDPDYYDADYELLAEFGACAFVSEKMAEAVGHDPEKLDKWGWKWTEDGDPENGPGQLYMVNPHIVEEPQFMGCNFCHRDNGGDVMEQDGSKMPQREVIDTDTAIPQDPTTIYKLSCGHWVM